MYRPQVPANSGPADRHQVPRPRQPGHCKYRALSPLLTSPHSPHVLQCCTAPGCNWSEALALANSSPGSADLTQQSDVVLGFVTAILLGFVVLVLCLFIFFIVFCRKDNEEEVNNDG